MIHSVQVQYGERTLHCQVRETKDTTSRVVIHVNHDGAIHVVAPADISRTELKRAIARRARWIVRQVDAACQRRHGLTPRRYVSGETHFYLGRRYLLKRLPTDAGEPSVKLKRGQLQVRCTSATTKAVQGQLDAWYQARAADVFARRMAILLPKAPWIKAAPCIRLRLMRGRWGSCSPSGPITLNPALVKAPPSCIDSVLAHELVHLKVGNHGASFYRTLNQLMPGWKEHKYRLDSMVEQLMPKCR